MSPKVNTSKLKGIWLAEEFEGSETVPTPDVDTGNMTTNQALRIDWKPDEGEPPGVSNISACDWCHKTKRKVYS